MPAPAVMIDRATIEDILLFEQFLGEETVQAIKDAVEMADLEHDQAKADAAEKNAALKS